MSKNISLTGVEKTFEDNELIVSKTDLKGRLIYCNKIFLDISGYSEEECLGQPHNMIRHPDMPRCIFGLLWQTLQEGEEIFAYVINRCKNGDHYWVNAHVTPSFNRAGNVIGYHSNRRTPDKRIINEVIIPLYKNLSNEEQRHTNRKSGLQASTNMISNVLREKNLEYSEFITKL